MCTLAVVRGITPRYPLVVAANRDEFYARPAASPGLLHDVPGVVAGRDLQAGGTWLGCRVEGDAFVAGLLNRRAPGATATSSPGERSRGLLCLDALRAGSLEDALASVKGTALDCYGPFNLLLADLRRVVVVHNAAGARVTELGDGVSVLTNLDVNDPRCPRLASAVPAFRAFAERLPQLPSAEHVAAECRRVLSSHENSLDPADQSPLSRLCVHMDGYGTRSSTVILVDRSGQVRYFHATGAPCRSRMVEVDVARPGR